MQVSAIALNGMQGAQSRLEATAKRVATGPVDTVDLSTEAVELLQARHDFTANGRVLTTADEMERSVLNMFE